MGTALAYIFITIIVIFAIVVLITYGIEIILEATSCLFSWGCTGCLLFILIGIAIIALFSGVITEFIDVISDTISEVIRFIKGIIE